MKKAITKYIQQYKFVAIGIAVIVFPEIYLLFHSYDLVTEFPRREFATEATNIILRDLFLAGIILFLNKHIILVKQVSKDYLPIVIVSIFCMCISATVIFLLNLNVNILTLLSVFTGVINNILFVLLAAWLHSKWNNKISRIIYFTAYIATIIILFTDTVYFLVTSAHIESVVFNNLNVYSIQGVLFTTNKIMLFGIFIALFLFIIIFKTPHKIVNPYKNIVGVSIIVAICISANFVNMSASLGYKAALWVMNKIEVDGPAGSVEKFRRSSRDMLSISLPINLVQKYLQRDETQSWDKAHYTRKAFTEKEQQLLNELEIKVGEKSISRSKSFSYEKIIVIIVESFHRDFLHSNNSQIPAKATQFIDSLWDRYPRLDNYFTSNMPTTQGLNSMFISQIFYSSEQGFENNPTIFRILESHGYTTEFLSATSQYYNDEFRDYKKRFGMQHYRAKEDLEKQGYTGSSGWGFHNDVMYEETIRVLEKNRNNKLFLVTKTMDFHQPDVYCGIPDEKIPQEILHTSNQYIKGVYWENISLQKFFQDIQDRQLMDDKTLIIITADHNPEPSLGREYKSLETEDMLRRLGPIPLIFISNNLQPFENFDRKIFASQIDFAPTLLGLLGIPSPVQFAGRDILNPPEKRSFAIGFHDGTIFYKSSKNELTAEMAGREDQSRYEAALKHWVQDTFAKYFGGKK